MNLISSVRRVAFCSNILGIVGNVVFDLLCPLQVMKTYHMYHSETLSAENKLKEAERQGERQGRGGEAIFSLRTEDRHQRRNAARKIQKMKEKVSSTSFSVYFSVVLLFSRDISMLCLMCV